MNKKKLFKNFYLKNSGFSLVELIIIIAILGFLASISIPSSLKWLYNENQNSYVRELKSYLDLVKRETRRWGGSCNMKIKNIGAGKEGKGFTADCFGINKSSKNNSISLIPDLKNTIFQEVNTDFSFTPKGQISTSNSFNSIVVIIGGRHDQASGPQNPKCLVLQMPAGTIRTGIYNRTYSYYSNRVASRLNVNLNENFCISN